MKIVKTYKSKIIIDKNLAKTYIEKSKNELNIKCAGMPDNLKQYVTLENFNEGLKLEGKLLPKRVKGGVVLEATEFTMK